MATSINPLKGGAQKDIVEEVRQDHLQDMQNSMKNFFNILGCVSKVESMTVSK